MYIAIGDRTCGYLQTDGWYWNGP